MGERRGSPGAAVGIVVLTLVLTALLGGCAVLASVDWAGLGCAAGGGCGGDDHGSRAGAIVLGVLAGVCLVGGLAWAARVGTGEAPRSFAADSGRAWRAAEPGADLTETIWGAPLAHLAAGTVVTERRRLGDHVRVVTPDGVSGWVEARLLVPLSRPPARPGPPPVAGERGG